LTTDLQIAALALEYRATLASADADFARMPGLKERLIYSEVPPAMDGRPANQARKCLIRLSSNRTSAGRGVGWQVLRWTCPDLP
jgi:hypothetical protein